MDPQDPLVHGPIVLNVVRWRLTVHGRDVRLTANQFRLMAHLLRRPGCVFSRAQLIDELFGPEAIEKEPTCIDQLVHRTRRRLGEEAGALIETLRDVGYRLRADPGGIQQGRPPQGRAPIQRVG